MINKKLLFLIFSVPLIILNFHLLLSAEELKSKKYKEGKYINSGSFRGGEITDSLDLKNIRWADRDEFERLVLDIYKWGGPSNPEGILPNVYPGTYEFKFLSDTEVQVSIEGYRAFTAKIPDLKKSGLIREIIIDRNEYYASDTGFTFTIFFNKPVKIEVFELYSPARVVVDIKEDAVTQK